MELKEALEMLDNNKTYAGYSIYTEENAKELHRTAVEALAGMEEGKESYAEVKRNKDNFGALVEAFAVVNAFNKGIHFQFPLMFSLPNLFHPDGGVIITPIEDGLKKVMDSGNWPVSMDNYDTVAENCSLCLQAIRIAVDKQIKTNSVIEHQLKFFTVIVGNPESHPLIQQANNALKDTGRVTYMAMGVPSAVVPGEKV